MAEEAFAAGFAECSQRAVAAGLCVREQSAEYRIRSQWVEMTRARERRRGEVPFGDRVLQVPEPGVERADLAEHPSLQENRFRVELDLHAREDVDVVQHVRRTAIEPRHEVVPPDTE